ncbi:MAG TPA: hypothetical protein VG753_00885 [Candidatus Paceibacterota bacterium]|nr:hypothetical protein [Candidatus Paceibacterota bacterium]
MSAADFALAGSARLSFRAVLLAAGADNWHWWQVHRHMASQVRNPVLKLFYLAFGQWGDPTLRIALLLAAPLPAMGILWKADGPTGSVIGMAVMTLLFSLVITLVLWIWLHSVTMNWRSAIVEYTGDYSRIDHHKRGVPAAAFQILEGVQRHYPKAIGKVFYTAEDPIFVIGRSDHDLFPVVVKIWDEDRFGGFLRFLSPH